jgi:hypothetical protein
MTRRRPNPHDPRWHRQSPEQFAYDRWLMATICGAPRCRPPDHHLGGNFEEVLAYYAEARASMPPEAKL